MRFGMKPRHWGTMFAGEKLNILNETDAIQRQRCDFRSFGEPQCFWCDCGVSYLNWPLTLSVKSWHITRFMDMNDNSNRVACWGEIAIRFTILMGKKSSLDVSTLDLACKQTHGSHALPLRTPGKLEVLLH